MRKNILKLMGACLFFLFTVSGAKAQNASRQINEIKRNESYLFEEATAATAKEAKEMAVVKLTKIIADYVAESGHDGMGRITDFNRIAAKANEITAERGSQKRVFLYVNKQDVDIKINEMTQANTSKRDTNQKTQETALQRKPSGEATKSENISRQSSSGKGLSDENLAEWQKRLVSSFLVEGLTLHVVRDMLNTYRIDNKVKRYGSGGNPPTQGAVAFYIFADDSGQVVAVLGRDNGGRRLNYMKGTYENVTDYDTKNYIWFTLNN